MTKMDEETRKVLESAKGIFVESLRRQKESIQDAIKVQTQEANAKIGMLDQTIEFMMSMSLEDLKPPADEAEAINGEIKNEKERTTTKPTTKAAARAASRASKPQRPARRVARRRS